VDAALQAVADAAAGGKAQHDGAGNEDGKRQVPGRGS
jgi:hypothetical protein